MLANQRRICHGLSCALWFHAVIPPPANDNEPAPDLTTEQMLVLAVLTGLLGWWTAFRAVGYLLGRL